MNEPLLRPPLNLSETWMIVIYLFFLISLAYTRRFVPIRLERMWKSTWNVRALRQSIRDEPNTPRASLLFDLSFYFILALVIFLFIKYRGLQPFGKSGVLLYLVILALVVCAYIVKVIGVRMVKILANGDFGLEEYEYNIFLINRVLGIALVPIAMLLSYLPRVEILPVFYASGVVIALMVFYREFRAIMNASQNGVPLFYIMFYICTLEILPFAVGMKAMIG